MLCFICMLLLKSAHVMFEIANATYYYYFSFFFFLFGSMSTISHIISCSFHGNPKMFLAHFLLFFWTVSVMISVVLNGFIVSFESLHSLPSFVS